tara:strand:- start:1101 stop:1673 length:573 start_codon:yes stop_codon:yes gene_type:complete
MFILDPAALEEFNDFDDAAEDSNTLKPPSPRPGTNGSSESVRQSYLIQNTSYLLNGVLRSLPRLPSKLQKVLFMLLETSPPALRDQIVGSFLFRRFLIPAIMHPGHVESEINSSNMSMGGGDASGDRDAAPDSNLSKVLYCIGKILQQVSSGSVENNTCNLLPGAFMETLVEMLRQVVHPLLILSFLFFG